MKENDMVTPEMKMRFAQAVESLNAVLPDLVDMDNRNAAGSVLDMVFMLRQCGQLRDESPRLNTRELELARAGHKIDAIKEVRTRLHLGLKEAKDLVEEEMAR